MAVMLKQAVQLNRLRQFCGGSTPRGTDKHWQHPLALRFFLFHDGKNG